MAGGKPKSHSSFGCPSHLFSTGSPCSDSNIKVQYKECKATLKKLNVALVIPYTRAVPKDVEARGTRHHATVSALRQGSQNPVLPRCCVSGTAICSIPNILNQMDYFTTLFCEQSAVSIYSTLLMLSLTLIHEGLREEIE